MIDAPWVADLAMIDAHGFGELVQEIMRQGYDEETAAHYAMLIGDRPGYDSEGKIVVRENGLKLARLKPLKVFDE
jgi:hypothetical protein